MITKVKANKSFSGTTKYVLEREKAQIIGGNMYGNTTSELVEQFTLSAHLNPQLQDPCYHLMLSVPKTDRTLSDDELVKISSRHFATVIVLSTLKGDEAQVKQPDKRIADTKLNQLVDEFIESELPAYDFFIARHGDKENDHTHIIASRVNNLNGKSIRTWNNFAHSEYSSRLIEREFNLTPVQSSWESKRKAMTRNQLDLVERLGLPGEEIMRRAIETSSADKPTMPQLIERLWSEHQIKAVVSYYNHGGVRGIKFGIDVGSVNEDGSPRLLWKQGGSLNKYKCSFNKLQSELGVSYDPKRDDTEIKALTEFLSLAPIKEDNQQIITTSPSNNPPPSDTESSDSKSETTVQTQPSPTLTQSAELYHHYSANIENLLVTDRDKEIVVRALKDNKDVSEIEKILLASPAQWTTDEAKTLVLIGIEHLKQQQAQEKERLTQELLAVAVPIGLELIQFNYERIGETSFRFTHATLEKKDNQLVLNHDQRGELFRVAVSMNQSDILEYSPINVGEIQKEDIKHWREIERLMLSQTQATPTPEKGFSR
jgi:Relaxase/Mobilisation nuclease domain